jgi:two-component system, OmpR family, phosphate regulon response regulator PhoB
MAQEADEGIHKVVCIEDEGPMAELIALILKTGGFEAINAESGQKGLELIASVKPHVVLLDLLMPGMGGWEVYECMKRDEYMRTIPVIIVTAMGQSIDKTLARSIAKVDDYITKPFSSGELLTSIRKVLRGSDTAV